MSNPDFLPPYSDPSVELGSVLMPCLREQLSEVEARYNKDSPPDSKYPVIDLMTLVGVEVDKAAGEQAFSCWRSDCMAYGVVAICVSPDTDTPFSVRDSRQLQQCAKNTTDHSNE